MPEVIDHGVSGFIVDGEDEAVAAVGRVAASSIAAQVRAVFERRFTAEVMARNYLQLYWRLYRGVQQASRLRARRALELVG